MIQSIFDEWAHYSSSMGSQVSRKGNCIISVNRNSKISCDFSNSIVCLGKIQMDVKDLGNYFNVSSFQSYCIVTDTDPDSSCLPYKKIASLMVLDYDTWSNNTYYSSMPVFDKKIRFLKLSKVDVADFADVVFSAFKYDRQFMGDSIELYKKGILSSYVSLYGIKLDDRLVSCLLVHWDKTKQIYGIELVSTKESYQNHGYSKMLLRFTFDDIFNSKTSKIWLFAIKDGIAEHFYSSIGFKTIAKILISSHG